jgi:S1-C subfamily serine protease
MFNQHGSRRGYIILDSSCICFVFFLLAIVTLAAEHSAAAPAPRDAVQRLRQSTVFIRVTVEEPTGKKTVDTGTGFIITDSGYVLTASHLLASNTKAVVEAVVGGKHGETLGAYVVSTPGFADAALLQLSESRAPYTPVTFRDPAVLQAGDALLAVGFPLESDFSVSTGVLSNKANPGGLWQVGIPLNYGNSGGPVGDALGHVIGLVKGGVRQAQQINYIIPLNLLAPLLNQAGLRWPPFAVEDKKGTIVAPNLGPSNTATRPSSTLTGNCYEETVISPGLPPTYSKRTVCE